MISELLSSYKIILASKSPRRQFLLKGLDIDFTVITKDVEEIYPKHLMREEIPMHLCRLKADAFNNEMDDNTIVVTADTIVWFDEHELNKPKDREDAIRMLFELSGNMHEVYTGVCVKSKFKAIDFFVLSKVFFKKLSQEEIVYYVDNYKPYDKAGAYGAQEWIGYVAIERIEGSYFNVMGLPTKRLYEELVKFIKTK